MKLESYVEGAWRKGSGVGRDFVDRQTGDFHRTALNVEPRPAARRTGPEGQVLLYVFADLG